jgi:hypothetical protein
MLELISDRPREGGHPSWLGGCFRRVERLAGRWRGPVVVQAVWRAGCSCRSWRSSGVTLALRIGWPCCRSRAARSSRVSGTPSWRSSSLAVRAAGSSAASRLPGAGPAAGVDDESWLSRGSAGPGRTSARYRLAGDSLGSVGPRIEIADGARSLAGPAVAPAAPGTRGVQECRPGA